VDQISESILSGALTKSILKHANSSFPIEPTIVEQLIKWKRATQNRSPFPRSLLLAQH
jgi:hypothetical protein